MLTNSLIQSILPSERPIKKADGGGLHICVLPNGKAQWRLSYRFDYRQKTLKGGTYPEVSIDRARVWREEMKAHLAEGKDPAHIRLLQKYEIKAENTTFQQLAEEWLAVKREGWSARYAGVIERRLQADIFPVIGKKKVRAVIPCQRRPKIPQKCRCKIPQSRLSVINRIGDRGGAPLVAFRAGVAGVAV
ncbi:hypothetical protein CAF53_16590 [Sphingobium sp. LB126]|uniref:tyrosine-type recombinase/integrase n=1 Tax=Sphingobium sp. LB126 TaxID=1983755 RepID=UPI000C2091FF|nr:integrase arm-type DNA-binding domain-containing protein [Sphingobium sp. LB126]PJG45869.1 hypothetical protein CAF53_16590 [Sphingobium sp. LB126]